MATSVKLEQLESRGKEVLVAANELPQGPEDFYGI
jgi:hypothetical protein